MLSNVRTRSCRCLIRFCTTQVEQPTSRVRLRKPKTLGEAGYGLLVLPTIALGLGTWQVKRWRWKLGLIEDLEKRTHAAPEPLPLDLDELQDMEYRKVTIRGTFDHSREMLIGPRSNVQEEDGGSSMIQGSSHAGVHVVTPFKLADRDLTILVNRGWVPGNFAKGQKRKPSPDEGEVTLTAVVRHEEKRSQFMPKSDSSNPGYWMYRDIEAMAAVANTAPVFLDADLESSSKGGPIGGQTRVQLRNDHFSYILTWYTLSAITFWMWYKMYKKPPPTDSAFDYLRKPKL